MQARRARNHESAIVVVPLPNWRGGVSSPGAIHVSRLKKSQFVFRKNENLGALGAEEDGEFLEDCFEDTGDLAVLSDTHAPQRIVIGRTGVGKTALLLQLQQQEEKVAWLEPDELSLQYLSNSTILRYLDELGVNLDLFYRLLWRHILAVELIQLKYHLRSEGDQKTLFAKIGRLFGDKRKQEALDYLMEWGDRFWEGTELRVHEVTEKFESDLRSKLGAKARILDAGIEAADKVSAEDHKEIKHLAQDVVNHVQIHQLSRVMDFLKEDVFNKEHPRHYVVIDRLDENWVDDRLRYRLIRALIETTRDFKKIDNTKIVIALRTDLLHRVIRETRDAGFQEEKYQPLYLRVYWTKEQLMRVLDQRVNKLVRRQYTSASVLWSDVFPPKVRKERTEEYMVDRTMYRPRDMIQFANCCVQLAIDKPHVTEANVQAAESEYSRQRFRSLGEEWVGNYPALLSIANILLSKRPPSFRVGEFNADELARACGAALEGGMDGDLAAVADAFVRSQTSEAAVRATLARVFYQVGLIGIKPSPTQAMSWSFRGQESISEAEITDESRAAVCPMFHRVLGADARHQVDLRV